MAKFRLAVAVVSIITLILFIVDLGLAAKNKSGYWLGDSPNAYYYETTDVLASFALVGAILGIFVCIGAFIMVFLRLRFTGAVALWTFLAGIVLFFLCGAIGIWCYTNYGSVDGLPALWNAELALEVITAFFFILLIALVVASLRSRKDWHK